MATAFFLYAVSGDITPPSDTKKWKEQLSSLNWDVTNKDIVMLHKGLLTPGKGIKQISVCGVNRKLMKYGFSAIKNQINEHEYIEPKQSKSYVPITLSTFNPIHSAITEEQNINNYINIMITLEQFIGTLVYAPSEVHLCHLRTTSWKNHLVLDDLYKNLPEVADEIIEAIYAEIEPLQKFENVLKQENFNSSIEYVQALIEFVIVSRQMFDEKKHSNILSSLDTVKQMLEQSMYKLTKLKENLDQWNFSGSEAERQFLNHTLTYGGKNVRDFFDTKAPEISMAIEKKLDRPYRYIQRVYSAIFYSKLAKEFVLVFESYRHGWYAMAAMPMINLYTPEVLTQAQLVKAETRKELEDQVKKFSNTYTCIYYAD